MSTITFFFIFIPILALILLLVNLFFAPHNPYQEKDSPFECGYHSFLGQNRTQFNIAFFIFGLCFLVFDLEILLLYPYAVSAYTNNIYGLIIALFFVILLTIGLVYELAKGVLNISSRQFILPDKGALSTPKVAKADQVREDYLEDQDIFFSLEKRANVISPEFSMSPDMKLGVFRLSKENTRWTFITNKLKLFLFRIYLLVYNLNFSKYLSYIISIYIYLYNLSEAIQAMDSPTIHSDNDSCSNHSQKSDLEYWGEQKKHYEEIKAKNNPGSKEWLEAENGIEECTSNMITKGRTLVKVHDKYNNAEKYLTNLARYDSIWHPVASPASMNFSNPTGMPWTGLPSTDTNPTGISWAGNPSTGTTQTGMSWAGNFSTGMPSTAIPWTGNPSTGMSSTTIPWTGNPSTGTPLTGIPWTGTNPTSTTPTGIPWTGTNPAGTIPTGIPWTSTTPTGTIPRGNPWTGTTPREIPWTGTNPTGNIPTGIVWTGSTPPGTTSTGIPWTGLHLTENHWTDTPLTDTPSTRMPSTDTPSRGMPSTDTPSRGMPSRGMPLTGIPSTGMGWRATAPTGIAWTGTPLTEIPSTETTSTVRPLVENEFNSKKRGLEDSDTEQQPKFRRMSRY